MAEAYLDAGGDISDVIDVELALGLRAEPLERLSRLVLDGNPEVAVQQLLPRKDNQIGCLDTFAVIMDHWTLRII